MATLTDAMLRLRTLFERCQTFDWYQLQLPSPAQIEHSVKLGTVGGAANANQKKFGSLATNVAERCSHSAVYHPGRRSMYVFGGCTANYTMFNDLLRFDLATRAWTRPMPLGQSPTPKACASLVRHGDRLVLFGGWTKSSPNPIHQTTMFFNETHIYDTNENVWRIVSIPIRICNRPDPRRGRAAPGRPLGDCHRRRDDRIWR